MTMDPAKLPSRMTRNASVVGIAPANAFLDEMVTSGKPALADMGSRCDYMVKHFRPAAGCDVRAELAGTLRRMAEANAPFTLFVEPEGYDMLIAQMARQARAERNIRKRKPNREVGECRLCTNYLKAVEDC